MLLGAPPELDHLQLFSYDLHMFRCPLVLRAPFFTALRRRSDSRRRKNACSLKVGNATFRWRRCRGRRNIVLFRVHQMKNLLEHLQDLSEVDIFSGGLAGIYLNI